MRLTVYHCKSMLVQTIFAKKIGRATLHIALSDIQYHFARVVAFTDPVPVLILVVAELRTHSTAECKFFA